jgi:hypothetical protein
MQPTGLSSTDHGYKGAANVAETVDDEGGRSTMGRWATIWVWVPSLERGANQIAVGSKQGEYVVVYLGGACLVVDNDANH